jgi:hypothetical protein
LKKHHDIPISISHCKINNKRQVFIAVGNVRRQNPLKQIKDDIYIPRWHGNPLCEADCCLLRRLVDERLAEEGDTDDDDVPKNPIMKMRSRKMYERKLLT